MSDRLRPACHRIGFAAALMALPFLGGCKSKQAPPPPPKAVVKSSGLPQGTLIYMSEGKMWMLKKGAKAEVLADGAIWFPSLSPDCSMVAYWEDHGESMMLNVMNTVSRQVVRIGQWSTLGSLGRNQNLRNAPWWSPNSDKVYFADGRQIWEVLPDGHDLQTIYEYEKGCYSPTVSPDGNRVAFIGISGREQNIWIYSRLTQTAEPYSDYPVKEGAVGGPAWSPDGLKLAYVLYKSEECNVWVMQVGNKSLSPLTREGRTNSPSWDRMGKILAVSSGNQNPYAWQIALVNADDGKFLNPLAAPSAGAFTPSIDGEW